jgi:hypothetical protein
VFGIVGALLILAILAMRTGWLPFCPIASACAEAGLRLRRDTAPRRRYA